MSSCARNGRSDILRRAHSRVAGFWGSGWFMHGLPLTNGCVEHLHRVALCHYQYQTHRKTEMMNDECWGSGQPLGVSWSMLSGMGCFGRDKHFLGILCEANRRVTGQSIYSLTPVPDLLVLARRGNLPAVRSCCFCWTCEW